MGDREDPQTLDLSEKEAVPYPMEGYAPAHDSWTDESGLHAPELLANYKWQLVRRILINLIRSTAEIPHDQSSAAKIPHDRSSMAKTPHDQSVLSRCPETIHIRTLRTEDEEAFPTSLTLAC